jgi:endonuclease/exonuclease/phosphatase family metal-dependent hydrolase
VKYRRTTLSWAHYAELIERLGGPVDLWVAQGNSPASGFTNTPESNFYEDPGDAPDGRSRLDYILMNPGPGIIPVAESVEVLKFSRSGRQVSDHFGLRAQFELLARVE